MKTFRLKTYFTLNPQFGVEALQSHASFIERHLRSVDSDTRPAREVICALSGYGDELELTMKVEADSFNEANVKTGRLILRALMALNDTLPEDSRIKGVNFGAVEELDDPTELDYESKRFIDQGYRQMSMVYA